MLEFRSLLLSDVHLGTPDCQADYLLDFLRHTRSEWLLSRRCRISFTWLSSPRNLPRAGCVA